ncbi:hypothetical protein BDF21DRAFT_432444 [Thamnidium elegans]|uniref:Protein Zds1 C-terminal domain-containing protein n=1 Tax=Thamnidium elegans TaxID=101142 RepID=A0A8H7SRV0_9FUNG|nr:hypothetical protein INT48_005010 [Thamnidium elegans]KAI8050707.1 hypothetical protein BDF21DRAFT_432444 [Thamnidium elegans]
MVETAYSSLTSIADNNKQSFNYDSGKKEDVHIVNSMDHYNKIVDNRKASKASLNEFEDWVQSQGGEQNFTSSVNLTTLPRRKRSFLSSVSYSSEINKIQDTPPVTPTKDDKYRQQSNQIPVSNQYFINEYISNQYTDPVNYSKQKKKSNDLLKKPTWFTTLFQKQNKEKLPKKMLSITNLFSKKKIQKEQIVLSQQDVIRLPERYPQSIERVIYHISNIRLSNARRPLRHQVMISNMLFQYNSLIQSQNQTLVFSGRLNYGAQDNYYIPSYANN